jgi:hypothetical protein
LALVVATIAVVCGLLAYGALSALSRPSGLQTRLAAITRQTDEIERLKARLKGPSSYPAGAVCQTQTEPAIEALRQRIDLAASAAGVTVSGVSAAAQAPDEALAGLQPILVSLEANGPYRSVVGLLQTLSRSTPSLFIDTLDLKSDAAVVSLKFSGRLFCSTVKL